MLNFIKIIFNFLKKILKRMMTFQYKHLKIVKIYNKKLMKD